MKKCSKCGRTYPDHVDFCLRDGHPLLKVDGHDEVERISEPELVPPQLADVLEPPPVKGPAVRLDIPTFDDHATMDAFLPGGKSTRSGGTRLQNVVVEAAQVEPPVLADGSEGGPGAKIISTEMEPPVYSPPDPTPPHGTPRSTPLIDTRAQRVATHAAYHQGHLFAEEADIPSGFEESIPPEDDEVEITGSLSTPFIQQELFEPPPEMAPWEESRRVARTKQPGRNTTPDDEPEIDPEDIPDEAEDAPQQGKDELDLNPDEGTTWVVDELKKEFSQRPSTLRKVVEVGAAALNQRRAQSEAAKAAKATRVVEGAATSEKEPSPPSRLPLMLGVAALLLLLIGLGWWMSQSSTTPPIAQNPPVVEPLPTPAVPAATVAPTLAPATPALPTAAPPTPAPPTPAPPPPVQQKVTPAEPSKTTTPGKRGSPSEPPTRVASSSGVGKLTLNINPAGATVFVDGASQGTGSMTLTLKEGRHQVKVEKVGYDEQVRNVEVESDESRLLQITLAEKAGQSSAQDISLSVVVGSNHLGAIVTIDGKEAGKTPMTTTLKAGSHTIKIEKPGAPPYVETINVDAASVGSRRRVFATF